MTLHAEIARYSQLPEDRVRACRDLDLAGLERAIVIVVAGWSGQALSALRDLSALLAGEFPTASVPLLVCDAEAVPPPVARALVEPAHGRGETLWVCGGQVVAILRDYRSGDWREQVRRNTRLLG